MGGGGLSSLLDRRGSDKVEDLGRDISMAVTAEEEGGGERGGFLVGSGVAGGCLVENEDGRWGGLRYISVGLESKKYSEASFRASEERTGQKMGRKSDADKMESTDFTIFWVLPVLLVFVLLLAPPSQFE